jgi:hypothetical protein
MRLPWTKSNNAKAEIPVSTLSATGASKDDQPMTGKAAFDKEVTGDNGTSSDPILSDSSSLQRAEVQPSDGTDEKQARSNVEDTITSDEKHETLERTTSVATASSADQGPGEDDESKYPKPMQLYLLTFGLAMSTFVIALDNTIIATAIPRITTVFNSLDDVGWYGSSYLLTTTSLQPSFGKIYTYFNIKWTYIIAIAIFEVGSVLCAAAVNSRMLIIGRAVAGIGAAAIFSGGMTIVGYSVPLRKRPIYIGLLSSMFGISSVIGPILGGALTDSKSISQLSSPVSLLMK